MLPDSVSGMSLLVGPGLAGLLLAEAVLAGLLIHEAPLARTLLASFAAAAIAEVLAVTFPAAAAALFGGTDFAAWLRAAGFALTVLAELPFAAEFVCLCTCAGLRL